MCFCLLCASSALLPCTFPNMRPVTWGTQGNYLGNRASRKMGLNVIPGRTMLRVLGWLCLCFPEGASGVTLKCWSSYFDTPICIAKWAAEVWSVWAQPLDPCGGSAPAQLGLPQPSSYPRALGWYGGCQALPLHEWDWFYITLSWCCPLVSVCFVCANIS